MRPLSPGVNALLAGLPRVEAPGGLRTRVLAAHARRDATPRGAFSLAWEGGRAGVLSGAVTAALAAVAFTGAFSARTDPATSPDGAGSAMVDVTASPLPREIAEARVRIVDERLDALAFPDVGADDGP